MARVTEIYASPWLRADDLQGRTIKATIAAAGVEELPQADGKKQQKIVCDFVGAKKRLILNKTQAGALAAIAGDDTDGWRGVVVHLAPMPANNGKLTIAILPAATETPTENPFN